MRRHLCFGLCLLGLTMQVDSTVLAQGGIGQPPKGPVVGNDFGKKQLEAYEKDLANPAYDYVEMKNSRGMLIRTLIAMGPTDKAIELVEKQIKKLKDRGTYGDMFTINEVRDLAQLYTKAGESKKAVGVMQEYFDWCVNIYGPQADDTRFARGLVVKTYFDVRDFDKGMAEFKALFPAKKQLKEWEQRISSEISYSLSLAKEYDKQFEVIVYLLDPLAPQQEQDPKQIRFSRFAGTTSVWIHAGRKDLAEKLIEYELQALRKAKGEDDPRIIAAMKSAAEEYLTVRIHDKAITMYGDLIKLTGKKFGDDHIETLTLKNTLGFVYTDNKDTDSAVKLLKEVHAAVKGKVGAEQLYSATVYNLAAALEVAGKLTDSEAYLREYLETEKKNTKSEDSPTVTSIMSLVGMNLLKQKKWEEAESILRQSLEIRRKKEPQLWSTNNTESLLGEALLGQKKYKEAETLLTAGYNGLNQKRFYIPYQVQTQRMNEATERLVKLYEATEQADKAEQYRKLLPKEKK